jgi:threonine 3-dehydrogenase
MMFMPDCLKATCDLIDADNSKLTQRTYNVAAVSFTPEEITASLNEHIATLGNKTRAKHLKMVYQPDIRDSIAKTWPAALNDSAARKDWNWKPDFELKELTSGTTNRYCNDWPPADKFLPLQKCWLASRRS